MAYHVVGPLAVIKLAGKVQYFYHGAVVPEGVDRSQLDRLIDSGLVAEVEAVAPGGEDVIEERAVPAEDPPPVGDRPMRPLQVAPKGAWVDYAVARGMPKELAEGKTKQELIGQWGN